MPFPSPQSTSSPNNATALEFHRSHPHQTKYNDPYECSRINIEGFAQRSELRRIRKRLSPRFSTRIICPPILFLTALPTTITTLYSLSHCTRRQTSLRPSTAPHPCDVIESDSEYAAYSLTTSALHDPITDDIDQCISDLNFEFKCALNLPTCHRFTQELLDFDPSVHIPHDSGSLNTPFPTTPTSECSSLLPALLTPAPSPKHARPTKVPPPSLPSTPLFSDVVMYSQNLADMRSNLENTKLDIIIGIMISRGIDAYLLQETWLEGIVTHEVNGFLFLHHGIPKDDCPRGRRGVGIVLSPRLYDAYRNAGMIPHIVPEDSDTTNVGRFICVQITVNVPDNPKGAFAANGNANQPPRQSPSHQYTIPISSTNNNSSTSTSNRSTRTSLPIIFSFLDKTSFPASSKPPPPSSSTRHM